MGAVGNTGTGPEAEMEGHLRRIAEEGYTILENAIEMDFIDEIVDALRKVEAEVGAVPADNLFEGVQTTRVYNLLVHGPRSRGYRCTPTYCRSLNESWIPGP